MSSVLMIITVCAIGLPNDCEVVAVVAPARACEAFREALDPSYVLNAECIPIDEAQTTE